MITKDLIKQITSNARKSKGASDKPDYSEQARKAAAKKIMAAIREDNDELFLTAFNELKDINSSNESE